MKTYKLSIYGCHDENVTDINLTDNEFKVLEKISNKLEESSTYGCEPVLDYELVDIKKEELKMTSKEHDYVMYLMERVFTELDYDEDTFLTLDIDKITSELNEQMKDLQKTIKEGL